MRFRSGQQLARAKRLRDEIIRTETEASNLIDFLFLSRYNQYRHVQLLTNLPAYLEAVYAWQLEINNNEVMPSS
ncbi:hypothetical protein D3C85_1803880 [compost metagenome]